MKVIFYLLMILFITFAPACNSTANDKQVEQLRKEAELAKKEAELAKKELELAKAQNTSAPVAAPSFNSNPENKPEAEFKVVTVRLRLLSQGASHYSPLEDLEVTLESKGKMFKELTDISGWVTFKAIPCGEMIKIKSPGFELQNGKVWQVTRNLPCTNPKVIIGSYGDMSGSLLTREDLKFILN
jgi:hypothetical protein